MSHSKATHETCPSITKATHETCRSITKATHETCRSIAEEKLVQNRFKTDSFFVSTGSYFYIALHFVTVVSVCDVPKAAL